MNAGQSVFEGWALIMRHTLVHVFFSPELLTYRHKPVQRLVLLTRYTQVCLAGLSFLVMLHGGTKSLNSSGVKIGATLSKNSLQENGQEGNPRDPWVERSLPCLKRV